MDEENQACACMEMIRDRVAHELATVCVGLIEAAVGSFHKHGHIEPDEAMLMLGFIAAEVIWKAGGGDDQKMAAILVKHSAAVAGALNTFAGNAVAETMQ